MKNRATTLLDFHTSQPVGSPRANISLSTAFPLNKYSELLKKEVILFTDRLKEWKPPVIRKNLSNKNRERRGAVLSLMSLSFLLGLSVNQRIPGWRQSSSPGQDFPKSLGSALKSSSALSAGFLWLLSSPGSRGL